jgi:hypothetical protein
VRVKLTTQKSQLTAGSSQLAACSSMFASEKNLCRSDRSLYLSNQFELCWKQKNPLAGSVLVLASTKEIEGN